MAELGVYIHYPWCRKHCPYCDFAVAVARRSEPPHAAYRAAVIAELAARAPQVAGRQLVSIYFGGGTPSMWPPEELFAVIREVRRSFDAAAAVEVTLEANPTDCTASAVRAWLDVGITRLSIGVQSFDDRRLATLGRDHRFGDGAAALRVARAARVPEVNADVILGVPGGRSDSPQVCDTSVITAADAGPAHLSVYELTFEPRTALTRAVRRGVLAPMDDDAVADAYVAAHRALIARGYEHYEISAYARPGHRAVHNMLYWRLGEYLGLGNGAASFVRDASGGGRRTMNVRSAKAYLRGARTVAQEPLTAAEIEVDRLWLGLRTSDGVAGAPAALVRWLVDEGLAALRGDRVRPTLKGFLYADRVAARILGG